MCIRDRASLSVPVPWQLSVRGDAGDTVSDAAGDIVSDAAGISVCGTVDDTASGAAGHAASIKGML